MNKNLKSFLVTGLMVVLVMVGLSGCSEEDPVSDSSAFLQKSIFNLLGAESLRFDAELEAVLSGDNGLDAVVSLTGAYSYLDPEQEGVDVNVLAKVEDSAGDDYRFDVYLRDTEEGAFVRLLALPEIPNFPVALFADLVGPWWKLEAGGEESSAAGYVRGIVGTPVEDLEGVDRQKREELLVAEFFSGIEFEGTDVVGDYEAYKYKVQLNPAGFLAYQERCAELSGSDFIQTFDSLSFDGDVWVDPLSGVLTKVEGEAYGRDVITGNAVEVDISVTISDINMPFMVDTPLEYEVFDLASFFGAFFESGIMGGVDEAQPMDTVETKKEEIGDLGEEASVVPVVE